MSSDQDEAKFCIEHHKSEIQTQTTTDDNKFDPSALSKLTSENEEKIDPTCHNLSYLNNDYDGHFSPYPIKKEPEDSKYNFQLLQAENVIFKDEIDADENKPEYVLMGTSNDGTFNVGPDPWSDSVEKNVMDRSFGSNYEEIAYNCAYCSYTTSKKSNYVLHYNRRHKQKQCKKMYKCDECPYQTEVRNYFIKHFKRMHSKLCKVYKCDECSFQTRYEFAFIRHNLSKHIKETKMYKCEVCSYETRIVSYLTKHYRIKHSEEAKVYKCADCSFITRYKYDWTRHNMCKHSKEAEVYKCEECSYETKNKGNFTRHQRNKHSK